MCLVDIDIIKNLAKLAFCEWIATLASTLLNYRFFSNNSVSLMKLHEISPRHHVLFPALQPKSLPENCIFTIADCGLRLTQP